MDKDEKILCEAHGNLMYHFTAILVRVHQKSLNLILSSIEEFKEHR
jgi:hypothetical protein